VGGTKFTRNICFVLHVGQSGVPPRSKVVIGVVSSCLICRVIFQYWGGRIVCLSCDEALHILVEQEALLVYSLRADDRALDIEEDQGNHETHLELVIPLTNNRYEVLCRRSFLLRQVC
jgi:hypothetical protein